MWQRTAGAEERELLGPCQAGLRGCGEALGKSSPEAVRQSAAYQALARIGTIYKLEGMLKELSGEEGFYIF